MSFDGPVMLTVGAVLSTMKKPLLAVPEHENLARFVTFDAGARPKPILVMELVDGARCDKLIASRLITVDRAVALLDGVLTGLSAMHGAGVGHLDVKPSNVIVRGEKQSVLVDFGLAGRHLRPGCGTSSYGAPEVWGIVPEGVRFDVGGIPSESRVYHVLRERTEGGLPRGTKVVTGRVRIGIDAGLYRTDDVVVVSDGKSAKVVREVDGGLETLQLPLPAVVTVDLRLNTPRYASLPGIMKARKKELKEIPVAELGIDVTPKLKVLKLEPPPKRQAGRKVGSVQELIQVLHNEAKVI